MLSMTVSELLNEAVKIAGSQAKLGDKTGFSQNAIHHAIRTGRASAEMARGIDEFTKGRVPKWKLRPDLWDAPPPLREFDLPKVASAHA